MDGVQRLRPRLLTRSLVGCAPPPDVQLTPNASSYQLLPRGDQFDRPHAAWRLPLVRARPVANRESSDLGMHLTQVDARCGMIA